LYSENYKAWLKENKGDKINGNTFHVHGFRRLKVVKMSVLPKVIYRFNAMFVKIPIIFFAEIEKPILKFIWNLKGPPNSQNNILKEKKTGRLRVPNFIIHYKATVTKTVVLA